MSDKMPSSVWRHVVPFLNIVDFLTLQEAACTRRRGLSPYLCHAPTLDAEFWHVVVEAEVGISAYSIITAAAADLPAPYVLASAPDYALASHLSAFIQRISKANDPKSAAWQAVAVLCSNLIRISKQHGQQTDTRGMLVCPALPASPDPLAILRACCSADETPAALCLLLLILHKLSSPLVILIDDFQCSGGRNALRLFPDAAAAEKPMSESDKLAQEQGHPWTVVTASATYLSAASRKAAGPELAWNQLALGSTGTSLPPAALLLALDMLAVDACPHAVARMAALGSPLTTLAAPALGTGLIGCVPWPQPASTARWILLLLASDGWIAWLRLTLSVLAALQHDIAEAQTAAEVTAYFTVFPRRGAVALSRLQETFRQPCLSRSRVAAALSLATARVSMDAGTPLPWDLYATALCSAALGVGGGSSRKGGLSSAADTVTLSLSVLRETYGLTLAGLVSGCASSHLALLRPGTGTGDKKGGSNSVAGRGYGPSVVRSSLPPLPALPTIPPSGHRALWDITAVPRAANGAGARRRGRESMSYASSRASSRGPTPMLAGPSHPLSEPEDNTRSSVWSGPGVVAGSGAFTGLDGEQEEGEEVQYEHAASVSSLRESAISARASRPATAAHSIPALPVSLPAVGPAAPGLLRKGIDVSTARPTALPASAPSARPGGALPVPRMAPGVGAMMMLPPSRPAVVAGFAARAYPTAARPELRLVPPYRALPPLPSVTTEEEGGDTPTPRPPIPLQVGDSPAGEAMVEGGQRGGHGQGLQVLAAQLQALASAIAPYTADDERRRTSNPAPFSLSASACALVATEEAAEDMIACARSVLGMGKAGLSFKPVTRSVAAEASVVGTMHTHTPSRTLSGTPKRSLPLSARHHPTLTPGLPYSPGSVREAVLGPRPCSPPARQEIAPTARSLLRGSGKGVKSMDTGEGLGTGASPCSPSPSYFPVCCGGSPSERANGLAAAWLAEIEHEEARLRGRAGIGTGESQVGGERTSSAQRQAQVVGEAFSLPHTPPPPATTGTGPRRRAPAVPSHAHAHAERRSHPMHLDDVLAGVYAAAVEIGEAGWPLPLVGASRAKQDHARAYSGFEGEAETEATVGVGKEENPAHIAPSPSPSPSGKGDASSRFRAAVRAEYGSLVGADEGEQGAFRYLPSHGGEADTYARADTPPINRVVAQGRTGGAKGASPPHTYLRRTFSLQGAGGGPLSLGELQDSILGVGVQDGADSVLSDGEEGGQKKGRGSYADPLSPPSYAPPNHTGSRLLHDALGSVTASVRSELESDQATASRLLARALESSGVATCRGVGLLQGRSPHAQGGVGGSSPAALRPRLLSHLIEGMGRGAGPIASSTGGGGVSDGPFQGPRRGAVQDRGGQGGQLSTADKGARSAGILAELMGDGGEPSTTVPGGQATRSPPAGKAYGMPPWRSVSPSGSPAV